MQQWAGFLVALRFLTRLPVPGRGAYGDQTQGIAVTWFGAVGLLLGGLLAAAQLFAAAALPPLVAAALLLTLWVGLTGALHLDGLADCADAWMSGQSGEPMRAILKDVHAGTGAVVAVVLLLLIKLVALAELIRLGLPGLLWLCPAAARAAAACYLCETVYFPAAGLGRQMHDGARRWPVRGMAAAILLLALACHPLVGVAMLLACLFSIALVHHCLTRRLGGASGDVYGALIELGECAILVGMLLAAAA